MALTKDGNDIYSPKCCDVRMILRAVRGAGTVQTMRPANINTKVVLYFQCPNCGLVKHEEVLE